MIELNEISYGYGETRVLEDVSLRVEAGAYLGLIGPNGSGKTTLVKIMLGLLRPWSGTVRLFGVEVERFRDWQKIGYVSQKAASFNTGFPATVLEVVLTGRAKQRGLFRGYRQADREAALAALDQVGLADLAHRQIGQLSGGQQQRVFIARALASEPELLILDEPTVGVDVSSQEQFYALIRRLRAEMGLTVVMVSHDIGVVAHEVTELACLNHRLFYHGDPHGFVSDEQLSQLYGHRVTGVSHNH